ncbi:MAG: iron-sulfur cluster assembly scaffold protein [Candidatus Micrarchaeota archaeon]
MSDDIYTEFLIELYKNPLNFGKLEKADYKAEIYNTTCGDMIELYIKVKDGKVAEAKFIGKGCAISQASASLFTGFLKGKKASELGSIKPEDALKLIKVDLSKNPTRMKCALLPLEALKKALKG